MLKNSLKKIFNAAGFQGVWWLCVLGALWEVQYLGPIVMLIFLSTHMLIMGKGKNEVLFLCLIAFIGTIVDSIKLATGFISYMGGYETIKILAPLWITAMWTGFASTINHSLGWVHGRYFIAVMLGVVFGPLSYMLGVKLEALTFNYSLMVSAVILAIVWGTAIPLMYWLSNKLGLSSRNT